MAQKAIREYFGKKLIYSYLPEFSSSDLGEYNGVQITLKNISTIKLPDFPNGYVAKPDELFGKRGKNNLVFLGKSKKETLDWIKSKSKSPVTIEQNNKKTTGSLKTFLVEPLIPHKQEYYLAIKTFRDYDAIYFSDTGGVEVEENWEKVNEIRIPFEIEIKPINEILEKELSKLALSDNVGQLIDFIYSIYQIFKHLNFTYLEINPFVIFEGKIHILDLVARLDDTAWYENRDLWSRGGKVEFPAPFGTTSTDSENKISMLDAKSGASLKLKILNPDGKIWLLTSGGGGSVIFADTVGDLGYHKEIANYCDYSGNPNTDETREFCELMFNEMLKSKTKNKVLIIGGGIANFTDVAKTFTGVSQAIEKNSKEFKKQNIKVYVRRGGPNYKKGLESMRQLGKRLGIRVDVYGPEMYMTEVVKSALR